MTKLSEAECLSCMQEGDFPASVRCAAPKVAVVLTQSWCPQWQRMKSFIQSEALPADWAVFYLEYDGEDFFQEFLAFKEGSFGNDQVPYVRYYATGELSSTSNYADRHDFLSRL
jgi:hypothetical protein